MRSWFATFCDLAAVDPADPVRLGFRPDGTNYTLPGAILLSQEASATLPLSLPRSCQW